MNQQASRKIALATFLANIVIFLHHANLKNYFADRITEISCSIMDFFSMLSIPAMTWFFFISAYLFFRKRKIIPRIALPQNPAHNYC